MGQGLTTKGEIKKSATVDAQQTVKAWAQWQEPGTIDDSFNVSSIVKNSSGDFTVNWDTDFANANYCPITDAGNDNPNEAINWTAVGTIAVGSLEVNIFNIVPNPSGRDNQFIIAYGDQ